MTDDEQAENGSMVDFFWHLYELSRSFIVTIFFV